MDMANLSNTQQTSLQNLAVRQGFLLSDQAANNAAAFDPVNKQSSEEIKDSFNKPALEIF